jgi:predicted acyl esterase
MRVVTACTLAATAALAGVVGTGSAAAMPPKGVPVVPGVSVAPAAAAAAPAVPTFVNGMAQNVFTANRAEWITGEVWVESSFDSDRDGKLDRIHADYTLPPETMSDGLKVPVIYENSPYYASTGDASNWSVDHEVGFPLPERAPQVFFQGADTSPNISNAHENAWLPRGFGVVHSESPGTGHSDGCPTSGGVNETLGATVVIDWLNGRRKAYTTRTGTVEAPPVNWHNGKAAMMGTSYNGTIPIAAATTGVDGLAAIVPISAISDWYDYYRANGLVRAPHQASGGNGNNLFQGEDLDVLADLVYSRQDEIEARRQGGGVCRPVIDEIMHTVDRKSGDRSNVWQERNYVKDVAKITAATLIAHGGNDFNVMTKHAAQLNEALKAQGTPRMFYFHQGGHGGAPTDFLQNLWFTKYLWGQDNGAENLPKSWVVREAAACPPRESTVTGDQTNTTTINVASTAPFRVGNTLTIPVRNASGTTTNVTRLITNIAGTTLTLASAVATTEGQKVADAATVLLACNTANPTPYPDWPDPGARDVTLQLLSGGGSRGHLTFGGRPGAPETLTDDPSVTALTAMNSATHSARLLYATNALTSNVRISGTPRVSLSAAFTKPKANLSVYLVSLPETGNGTILTRGWMDPENRTSDWTSEAVTPGQFYRLNVDLQAKDAIVPAGRRIALLVMSTDRDYTVRPAAGTQVTVDIADSAFTLPVVGGMGTFAPAINAAAIDGSVTASVPATLSLTLGSAPSFGAFTAGMARDYTASTTANVISTAGDATLSVADPGLTHTGKLVNGAYTLAQPLHANAKSGAFAPVGGSADPTTLLTYSAPISNDAVTLAFRQTIGANEPLRTGTYSKTLTFTLSTTQP